MSAAFNVVLPNYAGDKIAVISEGSKYTLPEFSREEGTRYNTVTSVNEAVLSSWHVPVTVARCVSSGEDGNPAVFALHNHDENWKLPSGAEWIDVSQLKTVNFKTAEQNSSMSDWLTSQQDDIWRKVPWSSSSWFPRVTKWINESVEKSGATVLGAPIQIRAWAISCVLRVATSEGTVFFKALPEFFGHEPILARYLSEHFRDNMIDIPAIEPKEHWMLTREFVGSPPESKEEWHKVFQTLTSIQKHCNDNLDELLSFGCKDRRLSTLPALLEPIVEELQRPEMRQFYGVNEQEAEELSRRLRALPQLCDRLADCGISDTIVHGDLWGSNVIIRDNITGKSPMIFDWTDAAISHPFFDIYCVHTSEKNDDRRRDQKQAHIDVWSELLPHKTVLAAFELSEQIAPYYYLLAYRNVELHAPIQSRWELMFLLVRFLRNILNTH